MPSEQLRQAGGIKTKLLIAFILLVVALLYGYLRLFVGIGGPSLQSGVESSLYTDDLIEAIPVAMDIAPDGRLFLVETAKFETGAGDNRWQSFWLMDDRASMSIADREAYIRKWIAAGELTEEWFTDPVEKVKVFRDTDGDGRADRSTVFAEDSGLLTGVIAGVLVRDDSVWVTNIPNVLRYKDTDGDDVADSREVLSTGYGLRTAFVGHDLHGLTWGPDGRIYFSMGDRGFNVTTADGRVLRPPMDPGRGGVFRMNPDGSGLELFAVGLRNPQELAFDDYGNLFTGDNNSDGGDQARIVYVVEGGDSGWSDGYQYQAEEDYLRGPWNAERMWEPHHEGQPAWMVPPLANHTNGPSGMAYYPGVGLPERYRNHFFLSDYVFAAVASEMLSFEAVPDGAGFKLEDVHPFAENDLFIDQVFGYDGKMYALSAGVYGGRKLIRTFYDPTQQDSEAVRSLKAVYAEGLDKQNNQELMELLSHPDQRLRRDAQYALAARNVVVPLQILAADGEAAEMARLHALWALWQQGADALEGMTPEMFDGELRAQFWRVVGDTRKRGLERQARGDLSHLSARVRYFAALALGKLGDADAVPDVLAMLKANADQDVFLRHAGVQALSQLPLNPKALAADDSRAVRLAGLLALRKQESNALALFLDDADPLIVVEAARAIYDLGLVEPMAELAAMAAGDLPVEGDDPQTALALHRRVIAANLFLGGSAQAGNLGAYAVNAKHPESMRVLALEALQQFAEPPLLDPVIGIYRNHGQRDPSVVHEALDQYLPPLMETSLREQALAIGVAFQRVPLNDKELAELVADNSQPAANRVSALKALADREGVDAQLNEALEVALQSGAPSLQAAALEQLAVVDWKRAAAAAIERVESGPVKVRQAAVTVLGRVGGAEAERWLIKAMDELLAGTLDGEIQLEVVKAAERVNSQPLTRRLADYRLTLDPTKPEIERRVARFGGDPVVGKQVFGTRGDCLRCHIVNGRGGTSGPDLSQIASAYDVDYLLDALVLPGKDIAPGYGTISITLADGSQVGGILVGETDDHLLLMPHSAHGEGSPTKIPLTDIRRATDPVSGMPPMGLVLSLEELRDVMAYLMSLK